MIFEPYLRQLETNNWSPETIKAYRSDLAFFSGFLAERKLRITQVTPVVISQYIEHMKSKPNPRFEKIGLNETTINRRIAAISGWFDYVRTTTNPKLKNPTLIVMRRKRKRSGSDNTSKALDALSVDVLLNGVTDIRDRAIISLFVASGLRLSELQSLNIDDIEEVAEDLEGGTTRIWGTGRVIGKGGKERQFFFD